MPDQTQTLAIEIAAKNSALRSGLANSRSQVRSFVEASKRELDSMRQFSRSIQGQIAALGLGLGTARIISESGRLDASLTRVRQTAGASVAQQTVLRQKLFQWSAQTGKSVEDLKDGFDGLIQSGQSWTAALATMDGINTAMAVTDAQARTLGGALTVAGTAFQFDLQKPGEALKLLDKMTVAGRLGNAELEDLSMIFGRIGVNAASAGFGFDRTLAFVEGLSMIERSPERLATLADSTLRVFTNLRYMQAAQKATGIKFFDAQGSRREALDVLADIKAKYDTLKTDSQRAAFIQKAFGKTDLDTIKGIRTLLSGDLLSQVGQFTDKISGASGTLQRDLQGALDNALNQGERLKATLRKAADSFAQPINKAISGVTKFALDKQKMSGAELLGVGALGVVGAWAGGTLLKGAGKAALGRLVGRFGGMGYGIAEGKAIEAAAGVQPVYVVNWPGSPISGMPGIGGGLPKSLPGIGTIPTIAAGGLAAPVMAGALTASVLYGAYKSNQAFVRQRVAEKAYDARLVDDLVDTETGQAYRPRRRTTADLDAALAELRSDTRVGITEDGRPINIEVNIAADGRVVSRANLGNVSTQANLPTGPLVIMQGD